MLFNSEPYVLFLPLAVALTWACPPRFRPALLVVLSYWFYAAWNAAYLLLIAGLSVANYLIGLEQGRRGRRSRHLLVLSLVIDLGALAVFKYLGLLDESAAQLAAVLHVPASVPLVHLILPLGLSFFTFEFIHYQADVFRGDPPIRNLVHFLLFPAFFPTQIAGPIKRYQDFEKQVRSRPRFDPVLALGGLELIARGLFKKIVVADGILVPFVSAVFAHPGEATSLDVLGMLIAFSFQIYMDFSGYTDIGRGSAQLLGYTVPQNFDAPYLATSIRAFWRRWHMSLSSWLRDYLYIPLGGSRRGPGRTRVNLMITMTLGGLWHGAAWHFMAWGFAQGVALVADRALAERLGRRLSGVPAWVRVPAAWAATQAVVLLLWGIFRAPDLQTAGLLLVRLLHVSAARNLVSLSQLAVILGIAAATLLLQLAARHRLLAGPAAGRLRSSVPAIALRPAYVLGLLVVCFAAAAGQTAVHRFIYFQF